MTELSIIVPVYNVEKYIRPCMESIFRQGLDDDIFEVIIVNDGSTDNSMEMITDIIQQHKNITVINQENQGLSVARNNGITQAKGEYILMPDSDDLLIYNSLPFLLKQALSSKADLIVADFIEVSNDDVDKQETNNIKINEVEIIEKDGNEMFIEDYSPHQSYVWRTLFRKQYIIDNHIKFVPGIYYQDVPFTHECYIKAKKCLKTNWQLNIYRRERLGSATFSFSTEKSKSLSIAIGKTWELTRLDGLSPKVIQKIHDDVFASCSVLLWRISYITKTISERENAIDFLKEQISDINLKNGIKQRIVSYMIKNMPHTLIHCIHFFCIIKRYIILPSYYHQK